MIRSLKYKNPQNFCLIYIDCCLLETKITLDVVQDPEQIDFINSAKRGGLSIVTQRLAVSSKGMEYFRRENARVADSPQQLEDSSDKESSSSILYLGNKKLIYFYFFTIPTN